MRVGSRQKAEGSLPLSAYCLLLCALCLSQQFFRILPRRRRRRAEHVRDFFHARGVVQRVNLGERTLTNDFFVNLEMRIAERSDLRQVRDANDLMLG